MGRGTPVEARHPSLAEQPLGDAEIDGQSDHVGDHQGDRAAGDLRVAAREAQDQRQGQAEGGREHDAQADAHDQAEGDLRVAQPGQGDDSHDASAGQAEKQPGGRFAQDAADQLGKGAGLVVEHEQGERDGLDGDAFAEREDHGHEEGQGHDVLQQPLKHVGQNRRENAAGNIAEEPGEAAGESFPGRNLLGGGDVNADELEQVVLLLGPFEVVDPFGEQLDIDDADHPVAVHDGESEEFVLEKQVAGGADVGRGVDRDDFGHHDLADSGIGRAEQQAARGDDAFEVVPLVGDVEIDDAALRLLNAEIGERFGHSAVGPQAAEVEPHVLGDGLVEDVVSDRSRHAVGGMSGEW